MSSLTNSCFAAFAAVRRSAYLLIFACATIVVLCAPVSAQPVNVSGGLVSGGDVTDYAFSPDNRYAVFISDRQIDNRKELYSVQLSTGIVTNISGGLVAGGNVYAFEISPDSRRVVFSSDREIVGTYELYVAAIEGSQTLGDDGRGGRRTTAIVPWPWLSHFACNRIRD
jgi:Tol biopolymer transport system component